MHEIRSTILSGSEKDPSPVARKGKPKRAGESLGGLSKIAIRREEARVTDQRREDRHRDLVEQSVVRYRRRRHTVRVINVSSRGAMIETEIEPWIGEQLDIQFSEDSRTRCVVRWVREGRVGLEFVNETIFWESDQPQGPVFHCQRDEFSQADREAPARAVVDREHRHTLLRNGILYWSGISIPVRLRNISSGGARVESEQELRQGSEVELDLGEAGFQVAEVRWSKDGQVGLRFAEEFDIGSLAPAHVPAAAPAADMLKPAYLETELRPDSPWAARFERLSTTDLKIINPED
jgi:PilZ domain-containing protein